MSKNVLLFGADLPPDQKTRVTARHHLDDFSGLDDPAAVPGFDEALARAEGAIGVSMKWDAERLARAPRLKVLSSVSVGVDSYDVDYLSEHGIWLGHTPDVLTDTTADTALALMLATARRVVELAQWVQAGRWQAPIGPDQFSVDVHHKTLGIVGMGRIGAAIARRAALGFSMDVMYHNRSRQPAVEAALGARYADFNMLLGESDFVLAAVPGTAETENLFDAAAFARMQAHAVFINIARGTVVDERALVEALNAGQIRAAGLDVFHGEPVGADHPLVGRSDVVALPHVGSSTHETRYAMARLAVDNLLAALDGDTPPAAYNEAAMRRRV